MRFASAFASATHRRLAALVPQIAVREKTTACRSAQAASRTEMLLPQVDGRILYPRRARSHMITMTFGSHHAAPRAHSTLSLLSGGLKQTRDRNRHIGMRWSFHGGTRERVDRKDQRRQ